MQLLEIKIIIALIFLFLASITDIKKRIVPNKISYPFIAIAFAFNLLDFNFYNLIPAIVVFCIGLIIYYFGKLGGGDIKIIVGLSLLFPFFNGKVFILQVIIFASLLSLLFFSPYYSIKLLEKKKINFNEIKTDFFKAIFLLAFLLIYFALLINFYSIQLLLLFFIPLFVSLPFIALQNEIKKEFFLKEIPLNELDEDEVIAFEFLPAELKEKFKVKKIITEKDKLYLKEKGLTKIKIYSGLPAFIPFIFLGTIIAFLKPEILNPLILI